MREERLLERVVEAMLAMQSFGEEVRLWDVPPLAEYHVDCPSCVQDQHF